ncbi:glutathione S-transferase family protein [Corticibacter populi]|uniref:Glutathione S-transferase family protein n=1 Tax=Corticibacter populi TaxID=1550736 RepID=A0A3M6R150_9BURK|nr:glutathione S-transferase family protein [Corticibacter populi]
MQLLYAPTSPYVRKVMASAHLLGLTGRIRLLDSAANPIHRDARIAAHNPMAKVPTMVLADGQALYDSRVICEYLDSLVPEAGLFPKDGAQRWQALTRQALGDGLLDAALLARYEFTARPEAQQSAAWRDAQLGKVQACLDAIEHQAAELSVQAPTIGEITLGCALGYLDFRFSSLDWRTTHPKAVHWHAQLQALPAMQATIPHEA